MADLIQALSKPEAFPSAVARVEVHQTHISAVFLGGETAYKIKKPVNLGFLDFSTLQRRRHFCEEEVRLNRRLAPDVYLGVVPIAASASGLQFEVPGPVVEWAVKMVRMSPEMDLEHRLERNEVDRGVLQSLARRIAQFHHLAPSNESIAEQARWAIVDENAMANVKAARQHVGESISAAVLDRLSLRTRQTLDELRPLIERRAASGVPRDTHGDLRVDHVYWFPERPPPDDWCILDGIEFNERFRHADPVSDMAFLAMDLAFCGRWDLSQAFADEYFQAAADPAGRELLPLYASYRAAVRGKVECILRGEAEVPEADRAAAIRRAKAHWLAAVCWLEPPAARPRIVLIGGLPGSGKTTLARALAERTGARHLRSDVVRKELAGRDATARLSTTFGDGIYSDEWNDKTYRELERRAEDSLWNGGQVLVDASFRQDKHRCRFLCLGRKLGVLVTFLHCAVAPSIAKRRLQRRQGDASDADVSIYDVAATLWEPCSPGVERITHRLDADRTVEEVVRQAQSVLVGPPHVATSEPLVAM